ncbi:DNA cytosine methyltransferase [Saccharopolyspora gregorii]|uniref:DNA cytosine methyltransferase n=1 Tax=Saccharopolyspora gregorii TaxID=33914 RepID=UPI0031E663E2
MATYGVKLLRSDLLELEEHSDSCTEAGFGQWCADKVAGGRRLAVDLFAGAGGLSLGMVRAGWTVAASVDSNSFALKTHRANFPGVALAKDLAVPADRRSLIAMLQRAEIDLIAGGPPCQPFSRAGRSKIRSLVAAGTRPEHDERKELWQAYLEVVLRVRPRAVLMENVPDMALGDDFHVVRTIVDRLERVGYRTQLSLVDAWRYGVPQHRKRLIVLARRDSDHFDWPEPTSDVTLHEAIHDLPRLRETTGAREMSYTATAHLSEFAKLMRQDAESDRLWDHMTRPVRDDDREIFGMMTSRTLYAQIAPELRRYKTGTFDDKYKRLDWGERSRSITAHIAKDGYWYIHPEEARTLTVREAARIQTFPDWFRFAGSRSHAFQQIGNAVPPLLGQAAATALRPLPSRPKRRINQWRLMQNRLTAWAESHRLGRFWCLLPGDQLGPVTAAVVTLLDPAPAELRTFNPVLAQIAARDRITDSALAAFRAQSVRTGAIRSLEALRDVQDGPVVLDEPENLPAVLEMKPAQTALLRLLAGDDLLLVTQPVMRVAARVLGTASDRVNTLTDGRVDLARLVGGGADAPLRMAAIRLIGQLHCAPTEPLCTQCPLRPRCAYGQGSKPASLLF